MTTFLNRPALDQWPDLAAVPTGLRTTALRGRRPSALRRGREPLAR